MLQFYFGNLIITIFIGVFSFLLAKKYYKLRKEQKYLYYSFFWVALALAYIVVFLENINILLGFVVNQLVLYYIIQAVAVMFGITILAYLNYSIISRKMTADLFMYYVYIPLSIVFAWIIISYPPQKIVSSEWVMEFRTHQVLKGFLYAMVVYIVMLIIANFVKGLRDTETGLKFGVIMNNVAFIVVFLFSVIDEVGIIEGWGLVVSRLIIMVGVLAIYLTLPHELSKHKIEQE